MLGNATTNSGTCMLCHQIIIADEAINHLTMCGVIRPARQAETVLQIKVATGEDYWVFVEAAASTTLHDFYLFLRNNWWECCGHVSAFIIDGLTANKNYMTDTLQQHFTTGTTFHYQHDSGIPVRVTGEVLAVKETVPLKAITLVLRKNLTVEKCESCLANAH